MSSNLPRGWITTSDPQSGHPYYSNPSTGESRWTPPPVPSVSYNSKFSDKIAINSSENDPIENCQLATHCRESQSLVPLARIVADNSQASDDNEIDLVDDPVLDRLPEFQLTGGQLADLCFLHHSYASIQPPASAAPLSTNRPYAPLDPHSIPLIAERPVSEQARLETRLYALYEQLKRT